MINAIVEAIREVEQEELIKEGRRHVNYARAYIKAHVNACDRFTEHIKTCEKCAASKERVEAVTKLKEAGEKAKQALEAFAKAEVALELIDRELFNEGEE